MAPGSIELGPLSIMALANSMACTAISRDFELELFPLVSRSRLGGFAHDKRRAGLLGQQSRLFGSAHQRLRGFLQVGVFRVRDRCFHGGQLSSSKMGGAPELSYSCQLSTSIWKTIASLARSILKYQIQPAIILRSQVTQFQRPTQFY